MLVPDGQTAAPRYIRAADRIYSRVFGNITALGELGGAVNVLSWAEQGVVSAEASAFALLAHSAKRDYAFARVSSA